MNAAQLVEWVLHEASVPTVDEVCTMPGRSRGECWGCPITQCPRQITPFEVSYEDILTIEKAVQKLRNNQIWVGNKSGRQVLGILTGGTMDIHDSSVGSVLLALLVESRERFLLNQAVESVRVGNQTIEEAAASVNHSSKDTSRPKNITAFKGMVNAR